MTPHTRRSFLGLGIGPVLASLPHGASARKAADLPQRGLCAHRGAMETHPENTLPALEEALHLGSAMLEFDVRLSRDGKMVLVHDHTVDRTTDGSGKVEDLTLEELRELDAGVGHGPRFAGTRIPTFTEALERMPHDVWLNCHLKGEGELGAAAAREIVRQGRQHQAFLAAETEAAKGARGAVPDIHICNMNRQSVTMNYAVDTIRMKADFIQLRGKGAIDETVVAALKSAGIRINYYEAPTPEVAQRLFAGGVDFPLVDDVAAFVPLAEKLGLIHRSV